MANLTLSIDDDLLRKARIRALSRGTSVNALLREYLEHFADSGRADSLANLQRLAESAGSGGRSGGWSRDDLQERQ